MGSLTNPRHEAFCLEYMKDKNATLAYVRAGYKKSASNAANASRLLTNDKVKARLAELAEEVSKECLLDAKDVLNRYAMVVEADPNELTGIRIGACRYCHGKKHAYQWRTQREFQEAHNAWLALVEAKRALTIEPAIDGGTGYSTNAQPHPRCVECDGHGVPFTDFKDTRALTANGKALFQGVKQTQHGIEIKMANQDHALDQLARHFGLFEKDDGAGKAVDALTAVIEDIVAGGSSMQITTKHRRKDDPAE